MSEERCENTGSSEYSSSDIEDCEIVGADVADDSDTGEDCIYNGDEPSTAEITEIPLLETEAASTPEVRTEPILTPETSRDEGKERENERENGKKKQKGKWKGAGGGSGGGGGEGDGEGSKGGREDSNKAGKKKANYKTNNNLNKGQKKQNQAQQKTSNHNSSSISNCDNSKQNQSKVQNQSTPSSSSNGDCSSTYNSKNIGNSFSQYKNSSGNNNNNNNNKNSSISHNTGSSSNNSNSGGGSNSNNTNGNSGNNKNEKNEPPNILKLAKGIISQRRRNHKNNPDVVNSFILKMHYCLGVCVFLLAYNIVQGNWFLRETIHCVEAFNGETLVSPQKKNICLSYPYTCKPPESTKFGERECQRRYQLFYRWIHFSFLILSAVYYTPRLLAKGKDHQLQKLLTDLSTREEKYDKPSLEEGTRLALQYFKNHSFVHTSLYARLVLSHAYALVIDMATVFFFDFMLHNGFYGLVYTTYPWNRNPSNFNDSMSQHFPPYAFCTIDKYNLINNARIENYGCHLMLMELYEKVFIVIWFLLAALIVVTVISVFFLLFLWLPPFNRLFLRTCITSTHIQHVKREVLKITGVGDLFALSLMKRHMNERQFLKFLESLVQAHDNHLKEILVDSQQTYVNMC